MAALFGTLAVAATSGLNALGELRLRALSETEGKSALDARRILERLPALRTRLLVLRVLSLVAVAVIATAWAFSRLDLLPSIAFLGLATLVYGVSSELASSLARRRPQTAIGLLKLVRPFELLVAPLAFPIHLISIALDRLLPLENSPTEERLAELEVEQILEKGEESGTIEVEHARLLWNVLEFKNTVAREIMVPRTQVVAFSVDEDVNEVARRVIETGHSRYPVYRDKIDHVVGVLYAKDLFAALQRDEEPEIGPLMRKPVFFTPEDKKIGALLTEMQQRRVHLGSASRSARRTTASSTRSAGSSSSSRGACPRSARRCARGPTSSGCSRPTSAACAWRRSRGSTRSTTVRATTRSRVASSTAAPEPGQ